MHEKTTERNGLALESPGPDEKHQAEGNDPRPVEHERPPIDDAVSGSLETVEDPEVELRDSSSPDADQAPTESAISEARPVPDYGLTDDHVTMLKRFSEDKWKFLMCVAALDVNKAATVDHLEAFFATFPNADEVEDRGWFDVSDCLETIGLDGGEFLSRYMTRTSYDFLAAQVLHAPFTLDFMSENFARKNAFWEACYRAVDGL
jgi:hypothetical protein